MQEPRARSTGFSKRGFQDSRRFHRLDGREKGEWRRLYGFSSERMKSYSRPYLLKDDTQSVIWKAFRAACDVRFWPLPWFSDQLWRTEDNASHTDSIFLLRLAPRSSNSWIWSFCWILSLQCSMMTASFRQRFSGHDCLRSVGYPHASLITFEMGGFNWSFDFHISRNEKSCLLTEFTCVFFDPRHCCFEHGS